MAVAITRTDLSTEELRGAARRTTDTYQARRLLALALVVDGASRTAAARAAGMERQTLRDWVHRYNAEGVEGLCDRARSGRPPRLSEAQLVELARLVEAGPDPARHGVVRWRCVDLRAEIKLRFEVEISERHVGRLLKRLGSRRRSKMRFAVCRCLRWLVRSSSKIRSMIPVNGPSFGRLGGALRRYPGGTENDSILRTVLRSTPNTREASRVLIPST